MKVSYVSLQRNEGMDVLTQQTRNELEQRLAAVSKEIEVLKEQEHAIRVILETKKDPAVVFSQEASPGRWGSIRKSIYEGAIELLQKTGKPINAKSLVKFMVSKGMDFGKSKDPEKNVLSHLNAVISSWPECVVERSGWGVFSFKPEIKAQMLSGLTHKADGGAHASK